MAKKIKVRGYKRKNGIPVKSHFRSLKGYKVVKVKSKKDVRKANMEHLLEFVDMNELDGLYINDNESMQKNGEEFIPIAKDNDVFAVVVHGRVYGEEVDIFTDKKGDKYISKIAFNKMF